MWILNYHCIIKMTSDHCFVKRYRNLCTKIHENSPNYSQYLVCCTNFTVNMFLKFQVRVNYYSNIFHIINLSHIILCSIVCNTICITGSVLLRFTKIPGVFQVFSRLILNFPGVKTIPILSIADRISYKYVCYLS